MPTFHRPVLKNEILTLLDPKPGGVYLDATLGGGGLAAEIIERSGPDGLLLGIDRDPDAVEYAGSRLARYGARVRIVKADFRNLESILRSQGIAELDGAVFDLGVSSHQLDDSRRGFSFSRDEVLSMKMDPAEDTPDAAHIVNTYPEERLAELIRTYGEERYARRIARAIVERRKIAPITRTSELADVIVSAVGAAYRDQPIHPGTRTWQALRIAVNRELEAIQIGLPAAIEALKKGARICVVSFHSLEDAIVKSTFRRLSGVCRCGKLPKCECGARRLVRIVTRKPIVPSEEEIRISRRSRSAKLRCAERV